MNSNRALENNRWVVCTLNEKTNSLSGVVKKRVILKQMPPKAHYFGGKHDPIIRIWHYEVELNLGLNPQDECIVLNIPHVANTLDSFVIQFVGPSIWETIIDELKVC